MEGLAYLAVILIMITVLGGPVAIGLTLIKTHNFFLTLIRRVLHGIVVAISLIAGVAFFSNVQQPLFIHLLGFYTVAIGYIALRREYFPKLRLITPLLQRIGLKKSNPTKSSSDSTDGLPLLGDPSRHGPVIKWKRQFGSSGKDGHGPGGQD